MHHGGEDPTQFSQTEWKILSTICRTKIFVNVPLVYTDLWLHYVQETYTLFYYMYQNEPSLKDYSNDVSNSC